ncbi:MAG: hypothetical protein ACT4R6_07890 [Gemmatimonadaceae bacterium]
MKPFAGPDGTAWGVEVQVPSNSNALVVFHHPNGATARLDRYAWHQERGEPANDVTARLDPKRLLERMGEEDLARLFRRSMPIQTRWPRYMRS